MTLFGSNFMFQDPPVMLVDVLINFGVKNQVSQVSFKIIARDFMSVLSQEFCCIQAGRSIMHTLTIRERTHIGSST